MPDPFAQYAAPKDGDPFATYAAEKPPAKPFVPGEMFRHRVSSDAPDGLMENLRDAMESAAHPRTAGDFLPYLVPSGVEGAMRALQDVPVRSIASGVLRTIGAGLESPVTNIALTPKAGYLGKAVNALADRIGTTEAAVEPAGVVRYKPNSGGVPASPNPVASSQMPYEPAGGFTLGDSTEPHLDLSERLPAGSLSQQQIAERVAAARAQGGVPSTPTPKPMIRGRQMPTNTVPDALPERPPIQADASSLPESPLQQPRVDVGAEQVGRQQGLTKTQVRQQTAPILGEQPGEASPILPQGALGRIIDTLKAIPPGSAEREAYVARATSGKTQWQVENIRRTLEHLGLIVPAAIGADAMRSTIMGRLRGERP